MARTWPFSELKGLGFVVDNMKRVCRLSYISTKKQLAVQLSTIERSESSQFRVQIHRLEIGFAEIMSRARISMTGRVRMVTPGLFLVSFLSS